METQKPKNRKRNRQILIYLTDQEKQDFDLKFKESKCKNKGAFVRKCIFNRAIYIIDTQPIKENTRQCAAIGNNINQIAKKINASFINQDDINSIRLYSEQIIKNQKEILRLFRLLLK